jgi:hypothetical protein
MQWKSVLKPEGSVMAGIAVAGSVVAIYNGAVGSVATADATPANHPTADSARKKAGYTSFLLISALSLITRDGNIAVLGYGAIIAEEILYRHAIMKDPTTGQMVAPDPSQFMSAQDATPIALQGQASGYSADPTQDAAGF